MLMNLSSLSNQAATTAISWIGFLEIVIGILFLVPKWQRYLLIGQIILFPILTASALFSAPVATTPFNVITFNLALWIISIVALLLSHALPTATTCKRKRGA